ncbi:2-carboxy-1,4-naphthoquinone phytyltransferase [Candidatus Cyanaurora vandensis]|uniref:2-carboxy-1,4-naphthoquinone phytyltransferase n=1 Tax=Candidatus Cyanaurora vandensis TaxID=2714958 RepID=UPI00257B0306|nr:2-carboxy-1,4-naphthoquinone phytyltransferase [Candidatus Cyanaurora vandensis]
MTPWQAALNPAIYSAAVVPVLVGTAVAFAQTGTIDLVRFGLALVGLVLIQAWINLTNDVFDAETGVDRNKPWSLVNLTGQPGFILAVGNLFLVLGVVSFALLAWLQQDWTIAGASLVGCLLGYSYQGPPLRFSYRGWGEVISFTCFGPIAVMVSSYAQTQQWSWLSFAASLLVGTITSLILYTHHFPQMEDDRTFGKQTPIVQWGTQLAAQRFLWLFVMLYGLLSVFVLLGILPWTTLGLFFTLPLGRQLYQWVNLFHDKPEQVGQAMPLVIQLHFWSGVALVVGLVASRWV